MKVFRFPRAWVVVFCLSLLATTWIPPCLARSSQEALIMADVSVGWWADPEAQFIGNGIRYGDKRKRLQRLTLTPDQRTRHLWCLGGSGGGKSRFAFLLISQDVLANRGFALVDAQDLSREMLAFISDVALPGPLTNQALDRLGDKLILIEPTVQTYGVPGYNFLAPRPGVTTYELVDNMLQVLMELWRDSMGPRLIDISRNSMMVLADRGLTLAEMPLFLSDAAVRNFLVRQSRQQVDDAKTFFLQHLGGLRATEQRVWFESSRNKWASLCTPFIRPIIGSVVSTFDFVDILNSGKICLINLSRARMKLESRSVLGGLLINSIHGAGLTREDTPRSERYLFSLYVDEAQSYWTETFSEWLEAGRKQGLSLNLFHQSTRQAPFDLLRGAIDTTIANCHTRVAFGLARQDAERVAAEFFNPTGTAIKFQNSFLGLPNERPIAWTIPEEYQHVIAELMHQQSRECFISFKGLADDPRPFQVQVPYVPDMDIRAHVEKVDALRQHVARKYFRPLDVVNREINERWQRLREQAGSRNNDA